MKTVGNKLEKFEDEFYNSKMKSCGLCSHQPVCSAFMMFKTNIEPMIMDEKSTLKANNLAWICNLYEERLKNS